jgi:anti-sigma regulatory factor (Ser/Thr protein kinase)
MNTKELSIIFQEKKCKSVKFNCKNGTQTLHVLNKLEDIKFPFVQKQTDTIIYLIMELITNSLRASREHESVMPVTINIELTDNEFVVTVEDKAGGFDVSVLPYDINEDPCHVDIFSGEFIEYREKFGFERFGMGIYSVKVWADNFKLTFIDEEKNPVSYNDNGSVAGTVITFKKELEKLIEE